MFLHGNHAPLQHAGAHNGRGGAPDKRRTQRVLFLALLAGLITTCVLTVLLRRPELATDARNTDGSSNSSGFTFSVATLNIWNLMLLGRCGDAPSRTRC